MEPQVGIACRRRGAPARDRNTRVLLPTKYSRTAILLSRLLPARVLLSLLLPARVLLSRLLPARVLPWLLPAG